MSYLVQVLLPELPGEFYFKGQIRCKDFNVTVYVTEFTNDFAKLNSNDNDESIQGYMGFQSLQLNPGIKNYLQISPCFGVLKLYLNNTEVVTKNCIIMLYDYSRVRDSQIEMKPFDCTDNFSILHSLIQKHDSSKTTNELYQPNFQWPSWLTSSMSAQHLLCYINLFYWLYVTVFKQRKFQIKEANYVIALLMDLALGYLVLSLISQYDIELSPILMGILEKLVNSLHSLLKWLMGAPAGLKLNNAFNKMLGKYFSYHIQLWWLFLDVSSDKLDAVLQVYRKLGYLGASFQAAMVCDMICVATFHSYCIYVYAARLFNIQVTGLIALLRLFFGRKRNPLRGGVDSCAHSSQQLFVGAVAFTLLLLLLPTTTMYYTVFTLFRLLSLSVQYALARLVHCARTLPLYVALLWAVRSPKVAGNILMEVVDRTDNCPLVLRIKMQSKSLRELVHSFKPPVAMRSPVEWTNVLSNIFTGKPIV